MDRLIEKITGAVKNPKILIALGLTGILLICLPSFFGGSKKNETVRGGEINVEEYRAGLEKSVEEIVSSITGSKSVKVVITLESGIIYSYADTNEGTSANKTGSGQESTSSESKQSYITVKTADGGEQALLVTTEMPQVRGVAVVCEGEFRGTSELHFLVSIIHDRRFPFTERGSHCLDNDRRDDRYPLVKLPG